MLLKLSVALSALVLSNVVHAEVKAEVKNEPYYQIQSVTIHEEPVNQESMMTIRKNIQEHRILRNQGLDDKLNPGDILDPVKEVDATLDTIINMGAKIWKIFEAMTPGVNINMQTANALPREAKDWRDMSNWSDIEGRQYSVEYKNAYRMTVVRFSVLLTYSHSGQFKGKGQYLSDVNFLANDLYIAPLYSIEGESKVVRVINTGTEKAPVAGMEMNLVWRVNNVLFKTQRAINYFLKGDGNLTVRELKD